MLKYLNQNQYMNQAHAYPSGQQAVANGGQNTLYPQAGTQNGAASSSAHRNNQPKKYLKNL